MQTFAQMGLHVPELLLPSNPSDPAWPCIACDQYTSQIELWQQLERLTCGRPSTLSMVLPEVYLSETEQRLPKILSAMQTYEQSVLTNRFTGFVLNRRVTQSGARLGLVVAADLEAYDFSPDSTSLIRATEGTIIERLPPRIRVREQAMLECSHILLLANDPSRYLLEPLYDRLKDTDPLYDVELALGGGRLTGWKVEGALLEQARASLSLLFEEKGENPFLAVGDGNHSLATAKAIWTQKKSQVSPSHPARYAMCEVTNLYDDALVFEPIHRCLFGVGKEKLLEALNGFVHKKADLSCRPGKDQALLADSSGAYLYSNIDLRSLQGILDDLNGTAFSSLDYVHGDSTALSIGTEPDNAAILLPAMDKYSLFPSVSGGPLPRKAFSMGEANEKRYYMESRRIVP